MAETKDSASYFRKITGASAARTEGLAPQSADVEAPDFQHLPLTKEERAIAQETYRRAHAGLDLSPVHRAAMEAIILPDKRPVVDVTKGDYGAVTHPDWARLNDVATHATLRKTFPSIGRVELSGDPSRPYAGTGFFVGDGLLMTNRHVAELFATGLGVTSLDFLPGFGSSVDTARDPDPATPFRVLGVEMIHPYWDMALLKVDGDMSRHPKLTLRARRAEDFIGKPVALIGYPALDPTQFVDLQKSLFRNLFYVKRLAPGVVEPRRNVLSFNRSVSALAHDASTLGGNSGSAVVDFDSGDVIGLHFLGAYFDANFAVPICELARDQRIVDAGVNFMNAVPDPAATQNWWSEVAPTEAARPLNSAGGGGPTSQGVLQAATGAPPTSADARVGGGAPPSRIDIAIRTTGPVIINISIEPSDGAGTAQVAMGSGADRAEAVDAGDDDPAAPRSGEIGAELNFESAKALANGEPLPQAETIAPEGPPGELKLDAAAAQAFLHACMTSTPRVHYGLGAKVASHGALPGRDFTAVDCSGFVRELIWRATDPHVNFPDGSVTQHDWIRGRRFAPSSIDAAKKNDSLFRIAFLDPRDTREHIGHVVLVRNGATFESHGGVGPDTRRWTGAGWQAKAHVFLLASQ